MQSFISLYDVYNFFKDKQEEFTLYNSAKDKIFYYNVYNQIEEKDRVVLVGFFKRSRENDLDPLMQRSIPNYYFYRKKAFVFIITNSKRHNAFNVLGNAQWQRKPRSRKRFEYITYKKFSNFRYTPFRETGTKEVFSTYQKIFNILISIHCNAPFLKNNETKSLQAIYSKIANKQIHYCLELKHFFTNIAGYPISSKFIYKFNFYHQMASLYDGLIILKQKDYNNIMQKKLLLPLDNCPSLMDVIRNHIVNDYMSYEQKGIVNDLISMSVRLKRKIDINWSFSRITTEHNKLMKEYKLSRIPDIKVSKIYKNILSEQFELIESKERLLQEGQSMHHCVASYASKINKGNCAIFSFYYNTHPYTVEIIREENRFIPLQIQGKYNKHYDNIEQLYDYVGQHIFR